MGSLAPPRTLGKMMHQLTTANYFQLTSPPARRMPLRQKPAPGSNYVPMPVPGFRWNVVDYGRGNSLSPMSGRMSGIDPATLRSQARSNTARPQTHPPWEALGWSRRALGWPRGLPGGYGALGFRVQGLGSRVTV